MFFRERVYKLVELIPPGRVSSYKEIALALNCSPRAVGRALKFNPYPVKVPCHRIVKSNGVLGGFSLGVERKKSLLEEEGVRVRDNKVVDFSRVFFHL